MGLCLAGSGNRREGSSGTVLGEESEGSRKVLARSRWVMARPLFFTLRWGGGGHQRALGSTGRDPSYIRDHCDCWVVEGFREARVQAGCCLRK